MERDSSAACQAMELCDLIEWLDHATAEVMCVLYRDRSRRDEVGTGIRGCHCKSALCIKDRSLACEGTCRYSTEYRSSAKFCSNDMGLLVCQKLFSFADQDAERELIGERTSRGEESSFLSKECGHAGLESVDGLIVSVDIVSDPRLAHCFQHGRCRLGDCVGSKINDHLLPFSQLDLQTYQSRG